MRKFHLVRDIDVTGVSGTGTVAEGVLLSNGVAVLSWRGEFSSVAMYMKGMPEVEHIHGHGGATRVVWQEFGDDGAVAAYTFAEAFGHSSSVVQDAVEDIAAVYAGTMTLNQFRANNGLCLDGESHFSADCGVHHE